MLLFVSFSFRLRRVALTYMTGIVMPLVLATWAGFFAFIINPQSGERIGLGMTVMLTSAAIYLVASEVLPPTNEYTIVTVVYVFSLGFSLLTLLVSVVSVSLHCVVANEGLLTDKHLLSLFLDADEDRNGTLDRDELQAAVAHMGLPDEKEKRLLQILARRRRACQDAAIDFAAWYDIVAEMQRADSIRSRLSAHHSVFVTSVRIIRVACTGPRCAARWCRSGSSVVSDDEARRARDARKKAFSSSPLFVRDILAPAWLPPPPIIVSGM